MHGTEDRVQVEDRRAWGALRAIAVLVLVSACSASRSPAPTDVVQPAWTPRAVSSPSAATVSPAPAASAPASSSGGPVESACEPLSSTPATRSTDDAERVASACDETHLVVFEASGAQTSFTLPPLPADRRAVGDPGQFSLIELIWSPDGAWLAVARPDGLRLWSTATGDWLRDREGPWLHVPRAGFFPGLRFQPLDPRAPGGASGGIAVFDRAHLQQVIDRQNLVEEGRIPAAGAGVTLYDLPSGARGTILRDAAPIASVDWHPLGDFVAIGSGWHSAGNMVLLGGTEVRVWRVSTAIETTRWRGHTAHHVPGASKVFVERGAPGREGATPDGDPIYGGHVDLLDARSGKVLASSRGTLLAFSDDGRHAMLARRYAYWRPGRAPKLLDDNWWTEPQQAMRSIRDLGLPPLRWVDPFVPNRPLFARAGVFEAPSPALVDAFASRKILIEPRLVNGRCRLALADADAGRFEGDPAALAEARRCPRGDRRLPADLQSTSGLLSNLPRTP